MPHFAKPYYREKRECWYVQINKVEHTLGRDKAEAFRLYHELMARPTDQPPPVRKSDLLALQIVDDFLGWAQKNRRPATYDIYSRLLTIFARGVPATLTVAELKPHHVTRVMDAHDDWNANTRHNFATAVNRAFNWAEKQGYIDRNPVRHVEKPAREARELTISPADHAEVMAAVREPNFRTLLELAWESGARPQELVRIEARYFDPDNRRVVFPPKEAKGKKYHRVIYLGTDRAREIVAAACERNPTGPILRNSEGRPWTKDAINCSFCRLKEKLGRKLHLGAYRKGFCTEALKNGVGVIELGQLMGHANSAMIARVYSRIQNDSGYMAEMARKAKGG